MLSKMPEIQTFLDSASSNLPKFRKRKNIDNTLTFRHVAVPARMPGPGVLAVLHHSPLVHFVHSVVRTPTYI